jgi:hypothetical protein
MISEEIEELLILLEEIEKSISNIYGTFAVNESFTDEAKSFWAMMMQAELEHAALFRNIREEAKNKEDVQIELNFDTDHLQKSYQEIKNTQRIVTEGEIPEKKAYALAANIEENLCEYSFIKRVKSNDRDIMKRINKVEEDTKKHYYLLHNYSLDE